MSKRPNYVKVNGVWVNANEPPKTKSNGFQLHNGVKFHGFVCFCLVLILGFCLNLNNAQDIMAHNNSTNITMAGPTEEIATEIIAPEQIENELETEMVTEEVNMETIIEESETENIVESETATELIENEPALIVEHKQSYEVEELEHVSKWTTSSLNLRTGPGTKYDAVAAVAFNTELTITGTAKGWYRVEYKDKEYWVFGEYLSSEKYVAPVVEQKDEVKSEYVEHVGPYDNIVIGDDGTSSVVTAANVYWNKNVPENLKKWFVDNGWKIKVSAQSLKTRFCYDVSIAGITVGDEKTIYLDNRKSVIAKSMLHEIGHAVDINLAPNLSYSWDFEELYNKECNNFVDCTGDSDYAKSNPQEYFASVFVNIILNKNKVISQCPETVDYILSNLPY